MKKRNVPLGSTKAAIDAGLGIFTVYGRFRDGVLYDHLNGGHILCSTYGSLREKMHDKLAYHNVTTNEYKEYVIIQSLVVEKDVSQGE